MPKRVLSDLSRWERFKLYCADLGNITFGFSEQTNIHGFNEFTLRDHRLLQLGWFILVMSMFGFMIYVLRYMILTTTWYSVSISKKSPKTFPDVMFCPQRWIDCTKVKSYDIDEDLMDFILMFAFSNFQFMSNHSDVAKTNLTLAREKFRNFTAVHNFSTIHQIYEALAWDVSKIFPESQQSGSALNSIKPFVRSYSVCYQVHFGEQKANSLHRPSVLTYQIPMFIDDSGGSMDEGYFCPNLWKRKTSSVSLGAFHTMTLREYIRDTVSPSLYRQDAHLVMVGPPDSESRIAENSYQVRRGYSYMFKIVAQGHKWLVDKNKRCDKDNALSEMNCVVDHEKDFTKQAFGCEWFYGETNSEVSLPYCLMDDRVARIEDLYKLPSNNSINLSHLYAQFGTCLSPCSRWIYEPQIIALGNGTLFPLDMGTLMFAYANIDDSIAYEEQAAQTWYTVLSSVGGIMSLFSGISCLAVSNIVYWYVFRQVIPKPKTVKNFTRQVSSSMRRTGDTIRRNFSHGSHLSKLSGSFDATSTLSRLSHRRSSCRSVGRSSTSNETSQQPTRPELLSPNVGGSRSRLKRLSMPTFRFSLRPSFGSPESSQSPTKRVAIKAKATIRKISRIPRYYWESAVTLDDDRLKEANRKVSEERKLSKQEHSFEPPEADAEKLSAVLETAPTMEEVYVEVKDDIPQHATSDEIYTELPAFSISGDFTSDDSQDER